MFPERRQKTKTSVNLTFKGGLADSKLCRLENEGTWYAKPEKSDFSIICKKDYECDDDFNTSMLCFVT